MIRDMQTVVELFPGIRDHYSIPLGFLTAEEKQVARAQIPKWEVLIPDLRLEAACADICAVDAQRTFRENPCFTTKVCTINANDSSYKAQQAQQAHREVLREIDALKRLVAKTKGVRRPSSTIQQHMEK